MSKFLPNYSRLLVGSDASRHQTKIALCGGFDPYEVCLKTTDNSCDLAPNVTREDLFEYLVLSTELYSLKQLKSLKAMGGHNFVSSGHLKHLSFMKIPRNRTLVFGKVKHSQRANETSLRTWVLLKDSGEVITGHCNCMAGNGSSCSHIGAVLFAVEIAAEKKRTKTCTSKDNAWLPPSLRNVEPCEIGDSNFISADKQYEILRGSGITSETPETEKPQFYADCKPTSSEMNSFLKEVEVTDPVCGVFLVSKDFQDRFVPSTTPNDIVDPPTVQRLPKVLQFFDKSKEDLSFPELLKECEEIFNNMTISEKESESLEEATRDQSKSPLWMQHRKGRITVSVMKDAFHTDPKNPALGVLNKICYPDVKKFENKHTQRGHREESLTLEDYKHYMTNISKHEDFELKSSRLWINPDYPHLGASPDGIGICLCHGIRLIEVKSIEVVKKENTGLVDDKLLVNHKFMYQIQTQMLVTRIPRCDFLVKLFCGSVKVVHVKRNVQMQEDILSKSTLLYKVAVLAELVVKYFSSQKHLLKDRDGNIPNCILQAVCICREPSEVPMINCANSKCNIVTFHRKCMGITKNLKRWRCVNCQTARIEEKNNNVIKRKRE